MKARDETSDNGTAVGRRVFLGMLGLGAAGIVWGAGASDAVSRLLRPITTKDGTGLSSLIPTAGRFRFYSVVGFSPHRTNADYRLTVGGLVDKPLNLTLADLQAMPSVRMVKDFQCVTGWRVPEVPWTGVRLSDVLDAAGAQSSASALAFTSFDGEYTESLTMAQARRPDVIVAYQLEDKPISADHGGPVRLYVAPMYGYKSCKWLGGIEVVDRVEPGYWENLGYDVDGWIGKSNGRDDAPV
jgi:DMSO/TMAO reductase YedYZ molybdopterin-dependent catalytic subunit